MNYANIMLIIVGLALLISIIKVKNSPKTKTIVHPGYWSYWGPMDFNYWNPYHYYRRHHGAPHRRGRGGRHRR